MYPEYIQFQAMRGGGGSEEEKSRGGGGGEGERSREGGGGGRRNVTPAENSVSTGSHCPEGPVLLQEVRTSEMPL